MNEEFNDLLNKYYDELSQRQAMFGGEDPICERCVMFDVVAKESGKRGMCGECYDKNCVTVTKS